MSYLVHLQQFEGPLGLLLYLIRKEEMDIFDINVNDITQQYFDYIRMMKELDLEVAGEFVAMAATLIHIKSRMLLPQYDDQGEVVESEDPRKELVQKLLEYHRFQEAAKQLYERPLLNRDVYARGIREDHRDEESLTAVITEDDGLFSLIAAYRRVVKKAQRAVHKVRPKVQSIAGRIFEIKDRLIVGSRVLLRDLLAVGNAPARQQLLITFLSMLELGRMGFVSVFQNETYGDIYIEAIKPIERNVLERVQEFDSGDAEAVATSIINNAIDDRIDMRETMQEAMTLAGGGADSDLVAIDSQLTLSSELETIEAVSEISHTEDLALDMASDDEIMAAEAEIERAERVVHSGESTATESLATFNPDFSFESGAGEAEV